MSDLIENYAPAPDGESMAALLRGNDGLRLWQSFDIPEAGDYTLSIFVSGTGGGALAMSLGSASQDEYVFNPSSQTGVGDGSFREIDVPGWYEAFITRTLPAGEATVSFRAEDNVSAGVLIFGGSLSASPAGAYIPTDDTPETVTDYSYNQRGTVTFGVPPADGAELLWQGSYEYFMHELSTPHRELYREIRDYLLGLFPEATKQIVQAFQNNNPTPDNAIVMQVLFDRNMDETGTYYNPHDALAHAQNSVNARLQLSFYGANAEVRSRTVYTLWKSPYSTSRMELCQPLYSYSRDRRPYINDSNKFEDRWIVDLALQYNPQVTYAQDFTDSVDVTIIPVTGA